MTAAILNRQTLHNLVEVIDGDELETVYKILIKFIPITAPEADEISAIAIAQREIAEGKILAHSEINWNVG